MDTDDRPDAKPTLLERLTAFLTREPEDREELKDLLRGAFERRLLDADGLSMIEGVLSVSEMTVREIMIPRAQMDCVSSDDPPEAFIPFVLETKHSRFPVVG
jgi:magnesium and cobalt transporter